MQKFYNRLLISALVLALLINIISFFTSFNPKQLINLSFFIERGNAGIYLAKHILFESGIYLKNTDDAHLEKLIKKGAQTYQVDEKLLKLLIDQSREFSVTLTGGMGLTGICGTYFKTTEFKYPFLAAENIFATAQVLKHLQDAGVPRYNIPSTFVLCNKDDKIKTIYQPIYDHALKANEEYSRLINESF